MGYTSLKLCSGGGGFEALPRPRVPLDLPRVRERLERAGVPVVDARVMLIARLHREVTIAQDGRVLIKSRDAKEAASLFETVRGYLVSKGSGDSR